MHLNGAQRLTGTTWWWSFSVFIAAPALLLAVLGLRAARADRIEQEERERSQRVQLAQLADAAIAAVISEVETDLRSADTDRQRKPGSVFFDLPLFSFRRPGSLVFYREKIYFGTTPANDRDVTLPAPLPATVDRLIDEAQTAETQRRFGEALKTYLHLSEIEPRLRDWARLCMARVRVKNGDPSANAILADPGWSRSDERGSLGLPVALVAAAYAGSPELDGNQKGEFGELIEQSLNRLRQNGWWLSYDERRFYDNLLRNQLKGVRGSDPALDEVAEIARLALESPPLHRDRVNRNFIHDQRDAIFFVWLPSSRSPDEWIGTAATRSRLGGILAGSLSPLLSNQSQAISLRDEQGNSIWGVPNESFSSTHVQTLRTIAGWEMAFGPSSTSSNYGRVILWYGFIAVLVMTLTVGLAMTVRVVRRESELARMQNAFVAGVSHDFKSPITSIRLLMERLVNGRVTDPQKVDEYFQSVQAETRRLERHVNRLLEAQQIQEGRKHYHFAEMPIIEIVNSATNEIRSEAQTKQINIEVHTDTNPLVRVDQAAVNEAIENLLENAIKYSQPNTTVTVDLRIVNDYVRIDVRDQGAGIDAADLPHIFERFYRGQQSVGQGVRGSGLGLALVKATALAHNGSVEVESRQGKGSCFSLRLPISNGVKPDGANPDRR